MRVTILFNKPVAEVNGNLFFRSTITDVVEYNQNQKELILICDNGESFTYDMASINSIKITKK